MKNKLALTLKVSAIGLWVISVVSTLMVSGFSNRTLALSFTSILCAFFSVFSSLPLAKLLSYWRKTMNYYIKTIIT